MKDLQLNVWVVTPFVQSVGMLSQGELGVLDSNALISSFPEKFQNTPRIFESVFTLSPYAMPMLYIFPALTTVWTHAHAHAVNTCTFFFSIIWEPGFRQHP